MRGRRTLVWLGVVALVVGIAVVLTGCSGGGTTTSTSGSTTKLKIALLLPETKTARYETQARPLFEAKVKALDPNIEILYSNANQDAAQQQSQADAALTNGANVLVLDPVDSASAASIVAKAAAKKVPVISYDRLILKANVAGIQRILLGEQYMTVYKAIKLEAEATAELAVALAQGKPVPSSMTLSTVNNGTKDVPSVLLKPVAVTKDTIKTTVVADGFWKTSDILNTPELKAAGAAIGLQ